MLALCQLLAEHRNLVLCCERVLSFSVCTDQVWHDDRVLEATARVTAATVIILIICGLPDHGKMFDGQ